MFLIVYIILKDVIKNIKFTTTKQRQQFNKQLKLRFTEFLSLRRVNTLNNLTVLSIK